MTPIERIARALCDDTLSRWRSPIALKAEPWREFIPAARAVLQAIREPSEAMCEAVRSKALEPCFPESDWRTMIDAALSE